MSKFNIGDIVVPGKGADEKYNITNSEMKKAEVIDMAGVTEIKIRVLQHKDDAVIGNEYWVDGSLFKKTRKNNETIVIYRKGNTVIATDKSTGKTAHATCMDSDTFNLADGQKLAFYRLMGTPEEKIREMLPHMFKKKETEKPFVIKQDHYNVGDKVLIVDKFTQDCNPDPKREMGKWLGKVMTIRDNRYPNLYRMVEDNKEHINGWNWNTHCIAGKVIDGVKKVKRVAKVGEYVLIVDPFEANGNYKKGDIVRISGTFGHGNAIYGSGYGEWLFEREYVVLEGYRPETQDDIKAGDMVEVFDLGKTYSTFDSWESLGKYAQNFVKESMPNRVATYIVLRIGKHNSRSNTDLALIQNPKTTQVFIVNVKGLRKVEK